MHNSLVDASRVTEITDVLEETSTALDGTANFINNTQTMMNTTMEMMHVTSMANTTMDMMHVTSIMNTTMETMHVTSMANTTMDMIHSTALMNTTMIMMQDSTLMNSTMGMMHNTAMMNATDNIQEIVPNALATTSTLCTIIINEPSLKIKTDVMALFGISVTSAALLFLISLVVLIFWTFSRFSHKVGSTYINFEANLTEIPVQETNKATKTDTIPLVHIEAATGEKSLSKETELRDQAATKKPGIGHQSVNINLSSSSCDLIDNKLTTFDSDDPYEEGGQSTRTDAFGRNPAQPSSEYAATQKTKVADATEGAICTNIIMTCKNNSLALDNKDFFPGVIQTNPRMTLDRTCYQSEQIAMSPSLVKVYEHQPTMHGYSDTKTSLECSIHGFDDGRTDFDINMHEQAVGVFDEIIHTLRNSIDDENINDFGTSADRSTQAKKIRPNDRLTRQENFDQSNQELAYNEERNAQAEVRKGLDTVKSQPTYPVIDPSSYIYDKRDLTGNIQTIVHSCSQKSPTSQRNERPDEVAIQISEESADEKLYSRSKRLQTFDQTECDDLFDRLKSVQSLNTKSNECV